MAATEFAGLAARMSAGLAGIRACLILSRDGLSLGGHPADGEGMAQKAWDALQQLGDPQRGFVDMGEEIWVVSARGAYAAIMVAGPEAKPGVLLDRMEAELVAADVARAAGDPADARPKRKAPKKAGPVVDLSAAEPVGEGAGQSAEQLAEEPAADPLPFDEPETVKANGKPGRREVNPSGVDRVALAREFGRLMDDAGEGY
jgi:hypothetical protein